MKVVNVMKRRLRRFPVILTVALIAVAAAVLYFVLRPKPTGGELYAPDFDGGFEVYVLEGYRSETFRGDQGWEFINEPHDLWKVTDENTKNQIYELCRQVESVRQVSAYDTWIGRGEIMQYGPVSWIDTGDFCYNFEYIEASDDNPAYSTMCDEIAENAALLTFKRVDMSSNTEGEAAYDYYGPDFMDDGSGIVEKMTFGWYSTMSEDTYAELRALIDGLDNTNAQVVKSYE